MKFKVGDVVQLNDVGLDVLRMSPYMSTLKSTVLEVGEDILTDGGDYAIEVGNADGSPNELTQFLLFDAMFDKITE